MATTPLLALSDTHTDISCSCNCRTDCARFCVIILSLCSARVPSFEELCATCREKYPCCCQDSVRLLATTVTVSPTVPGMVSVDHPPWTPPHRGCSHPKSCHTVPGFSYWPGRTGSRRGRGRCGPSLQQLDHAMGSGPIKQCSYKARPEAPSHTTLQATFTLTMLQPAAQPHIRKAAATTAGHLHTQCCSHQALWHLQGATITVPQQLCMAGSLPTAAWQAAATCNSIRSDIGSAQLQAVLKPLKPLLINHRLTKPHSVQGCDLPAAAWLQGNAPCPH